MEASADERPRIGISACLLGDEVRFDGGHKRDPFLTGMLSPHVEWVRVCPEVEVGMGTPREPVRLVRSRDGTVRMLTVNTGLDHTRSMTAWARGRLRELAAARLSGYVLKKNSPSCGMERVTIAGADGKSEPNGRGLFADALMNYFPNLPVEDEGRLSEPGLREHFIERVFAYQRLRRLFDGKWTRTALLDFHQAERLTLHSHSRVAYEALARVMASPGGRRQVREDYERGFMQALAVPSNPSRHGAVLLQIAGHLQKRMDPAARRELAARIAEYRRGIVPLVVPLTLVRHHASVHTDLHLTGQTYLEPHPRELMLRNHV